MRFPTKITAGLLALGCGPALGAGEPPRVRVAPVPASAPARDDASKAGRPTAEEAFQTEYALAKKRCAFSVREDDSREFEAGTQNEWCFDRGLRIQLFEQARSVEGTSTDFAIVVEQNAFRCAKEIEDNHDHVAQLVYCEGAGGQVTDFDTYEPRAMTPKERGQLLEQVPSLLGLLEIPERSTDGGCSASSEFDEQCFSENFCFTPSRSIVVSSELCDKAEALRDDIEGVVLPD